MATLILPDCVAILCRDQVFERTVHRCVAALYGCRGQWIETPRQIQTRIVITVGFDRLADESHTAVDQAEHGPAGMLAGEAACHAGFWICGGRGGCDSRVIRVDSHDAAAHDVALVLRLIDLTPPVHQPRADDDDRAAPTALFHLPASFTQRDDIAGPIQDIAERLALVVEEHPSIRDVFGNARQSRPAPEASRFQGAVTGDVVRGRGGKRAAELSVRVHVGRDIGRTAEDAGLRLQDVRVQRNRVVAAIFQPRIAHRHGIRRIAAFNEALDERSPTPLGADKQRIVGPVGRGVVFPQKRRRKRLERIVIVMAGQRQLLQVIAALHPPRRFAGRLNRREKQCD